MAMGTGMLACSASFAAAGEVAGLHPAFDLVDIRPPAFTEGIGGMDFLPDGSLAVCTWTGLQNKSGRLYLFSGVGGSGPQGVTYRLIAEGLYEPLGLKVVGEDIYVMEKPQLTRFVRQGNGSFAASRAYAGFNFTPSEYHQFATGLEYKDGSFHFMATSSHVPRHESPERGAWIRIDVARQIHEVMANGLREPNTLGIGPEGEFFTTDNQGEWLPANKVIHLVKGRFYGMHGAAAPVAAGRPISPPAAWIPFGDVGRSPSQPILVPSGPYQGHMLIGDVVYGGLKRFFPEKVKGEYQGALFRFSASSPFACGWNRARPGPDGAIYLGGVGGSTSLGGPAGGWSWNDKVFGLQKLKPSGRLPFEMLAIRSRDQGFEIEFTKPAGPAAATASNYTVKKWWYQGTADYGGPKSNAGDATVRAATLSADKRKVTLALDGMEAGRIHHFTLRNIASETGEALWTDEAWYTLLNPGSAPTPVRPDAPRGEARGIGIGRSGGEGLTVRMPPDAVHWALRSLDGSILASGSAGPGNTQATDQNGYREPGSAAGGVTLRLSRGRGAMAAMSAKSMMAVLEVRLASGAALAKRVVLP